jgi:G:T-mismatch repair DNA endonuclease (very short patch repair protein)
MGWTVVKVWECEIEPRKIYSLKREARLELLKDTITKTISNNDSCN